MPALIPCEMCSEEIEQGVEICPHCGENFKGVWRDGKNVVMRKDAQLPPRCIKTNEPAETWLSRNLIWHPPWVYVLIVLGLLLYVVAALIIQKRATIKVGLTVEEAKKRSRTILIAWLSVLFGLGTIIGGFAVLSGDQPVVTLIVGLLLFLGGIIYGMLGSRMIVPEKITDEYVWFKGACPEYLDELPEWLGD